MPTPKGVFSLSKLNNTHSTILGPCRELIQAAYHRCDEVRAIHPNQIVPSHCPRRRIKFVAISAGWRIIVHDTSAIQVLHVYTSDREKTKRALMETWQRHYGS